MSVIATQSQSASRSSFNLCFFFSYTTGEDYSDCTCPTERYLR